MNKTTRFIIIDDEETVTDSIWRLVNKIYPFAEVLVFNEALEGLSAIERQSEPCIILAGLIMQGFNGLQMLKKVKSEIKCKDSYFILVTSAQEKENNIKALQLGVDDLIFKPLAIDASVGSLRSASKIIALQKQAHEDKETIASFETELEEDRKKMIGLISMFQAMKMPDAAGRIKRVIESSKWIAQELGETEDKEIEIIENAASLCYVGRLFLPERSIYDPVMKNGIVSNPTMEKIPSYAKELLSLVRNFDAELSIIYHLFENFDGSGIPDKLIGWKIPIGSRILRVTVDFEDYYIQANKLQGKAIEMLEHESKRLYDFRVIALMDQYFAAAGGERGTLKETHVSRKELAEGMMLSRNIITESGMKIMSSGTVLTLELVDKIQAILKADPAIGKIYIMEKK